jgi:hypothetical protein
MDSHKPIIEALGGPTKLARRLGITVSQTLKWAARGAIAQEWRPAIAELAEEQDVNLPTGFIRRLPANNDESQRQAS